MTATIMKELQNLNAKLDLIWNLNDKVYVNPANLNATLNNIESGNPKENALMTSSMVDKKVPKVLRQAQHLSI
jgi:hypothetical protein